jgi:hypothetical protein
MELGVIISLTVFNIILLYTTINLFIKNEKMTDIMEGYIDFIESIQNSITQSDDLIKKIDEKGSFSSDDEVGWFFDNLKDIQESLNKFNDYTNINDKKN